MELRLHAYTTTTALQRDANLDFLDRINVSALGACIGAVVD
jgi:hypothetical protein